MIALESRRAFRWAAVFLLGLGCARPPVEVAKPDRFDQPMAIVGATLWDGTGRPPVPNAVVLVRGQRILCASSVGQCLIPPDARVIDARGRYLIPGLIDTHVHLLYLVRGSSARWLADDLRDLLARGVTTVRDMGNDPAELLRRTAPLQAAPRVYAMQLVAGFRFFYARGPAVQHPDGSTSYRQPPAQVMLARGWRPLLYRADLDADSLVAQARAAGASGIKLYASLDTLEVRQLVEAAHRAGMPVWAHAWLQPASAREQVDAGVDGVVHASLLTGELLSRRVRDSLLSDVALLRSVAGTATIEAGHDAHVLAVLDTMARRGVFLEPTLDVVVRSLAHEEAAGHHGPTLQGQYARAANGFGLEVTREAVRRGVRLVAGTDHVAYGPARDRASLLEELALLVDSVGLTPTQALFAATRDAAAALGGTLAQQHGTIEPGRYADLVLLAADPLQDIRNLESIEWVMRGGQLWRPAMLRTGIATVARR
ncbi:MAG TPA: amidohydrolase family protein [Gemmatimonadales bacterium]|nr:amidohydrolase family protein [Gemmatimonadales bacterium]